MSLSDEFYIHMRSIFQVTCLVRFPMVFAVSVCMRVCICVPVRFHARVIVPNSMRVSDCMAHPIPHMLVSMSSPPFPWCICLLCPPAMRSRACVRTIAFVMQLPLHVHTHICKHPKHGISQAFQVTRAMTIKQAVCHKLFCDLRAPGCIRGNWGADT